ncbi:MAG: 3-beta hydroxysteroid dehydrogenase [Sphingomonas bacterium]|nr:3-beta hydroxysteroid dehydrogenase [Sphingomonas bacterium]
MRAALIGATGFVGAFILDEALRYDDVEITAVVRDPAKLAMHDRLTPAQADVHDAEALAAALAGHDAVIHAYHPGRIMSRIPQCTR